MNQLLGFNPLLAMDTRPRFTNILEAEAVLHEPLFENLPVAADREVFDAAVEAEFAMPMRTTFYVNALCEAARQRRSGAETLTPIEVDPVTTDIGSLVINAKFARINRSLRAINNVSTYVSEQQHAERLRDYQQEPFEAIIEEINQAKRPGDVDIAVESATGSGKTHLMVETIRAIHGSSQPGTIKSLVIAPTRINMHQNAGTDGRHGMAFADNISTGVYYGKEKDLSKDVTVMTTASFINAYKDGLITPSMFDAMLIDECDTALGPVSFELIKEFKKDIMSFGFTATGTYNESKHIGLLFDKVVQGIQFKEGVENGHLAPAQVWIVDSGHKMTIPEAYKNYPDVPQQLLKELIGREARDNIAIDFAAYFAEQGLGGITECNPGNECQQAYDLADKMRQRIITDPYTGKQRAMNVEVVTRHTSDREFADIRELFETGQVDWITYVDALYRSFDSKEVKAFISLRPRFSRVRAMQSFGRACRPNERGQVAQYVHVIDDWQLEGYRDSGIMPFTMVHVMEDSEYFQGKGYGIGTSPRTRAYSPPIPLDSVPSYIAKYVKDNAKSRVIDGRFFGLKPRYEALEGAMMTIYQIAELGNSTPNTVDRLARDWGMNLEYRTSEGAPRARKSVSGFNAQDILDYLKWRGYRHLPSESGWRRIEDSGDHRETRIGFDIDKSAYDLMAKTLGPDTVRRRIFRSGNLQTARSYYSRQQTARLETYIARLPEAPRDAVTVDTLAENRSSSFVRSEKTINAIVDGLRPLLQSGRKRYISFDEIEIDAPDLPPLMNTALKLERDIAAATTDALKQRGYYDRISRMRDHNDRTRLGRYLEPEQAKLAARDVLSHFGVFDPETEVALSDLLETPAHSFDSSHGFDSRAKALNQIADQVTIQLRARVGEKYRSLLEVFPVVSKEDAETILLKIDPMSSNRIRSIF